MSAPAAWRDSSPTLWNLVFCNAGRRRWWDRLLRTPPGFSHVYCLRWDGFNWLKFDPHAAFTDVAIIACTDKNALRMLVPPQATVLEVEAFRPVNRIRGRWWIGPMTCVEQVKALLGLPVGRVWTPWQLYRYLLECCDGEQTENARTLGPGARGRTPCPKTARLFDPRGKRAAQGDQAGPAWPTHLTRIR